MEGKDILVVTATLGTRSTLGRTIESVKTVGGARVEHVLVVPAKSLSDIKTEYPGIKVIAEPDDCKGIYSALNFGLSKYAKDYKYLTYINDDDYWSPEFSSLITILDDDDTIDIAYGRVNFIDEDNDFIATQVSSPRYKAFSELLANRIVLFTQQATLLKSSLFIDLSGYDESFKLAADTKFWMDAIALGAKLKFVNTICAMYMLQDDQLSSDKELQRIEHTRILANVRINPFSCFFENTYYRMYNWREYFSRFINKGSFKH